MPKAEVVLWGHLKGKRLNEYKFRHQHGIDRYIVDFYCPKARLVIEIDGETHLYMKRKERDLLLEAFLKSNKIRIFRFLNTEIYNNIQGVIDEIIFNLER